MNNETSNKAKEFSDKLNQLCREYNIAEIVSVAQTNNGDLWPMLITLTGGNTSPSMKRLMEAVLSVIQIYEPHIATRVHRKTQPDGWRSEDLNQTS